MIRPEDIRFPAQMEVWSAVEALATVGVKLWADLVMHVSEENGIEWTDQGSGPFLNFLNLAAGSPVVDSEHPDLQLMEVVPELAPLVMAMRLLGDPPAYDVPPPVIRQCCEAIVFALRLIEQLTLAHNGLIVMGLTAEGYDPSQWEEAWQRASLQRHDGTEGAA